jgi:alanyl-tRNA synthetase
MNQVMMKSAEIRQEFLNFFRSKGHEIVPSASIVIKNDPTLLFTNAGMNQFKDYFLGNRKAPHQRVADTQKCLRVSGKHNDLEEVGVDTYHHTMFEMLGNWSFGDPQRKEGGYFKKEAIEWSWELLTSVYKIPKDRLYVTVFEGDEKENLPKDSEAANEWKKWIDESRIINGNKKDNFWEMGDTGPCGPCTEIHVDCRPDEERKKLDGKQLVNNDHPQVIEIWNNVFIQFNRLKDGSLEQLPARHVDTGMGLERLVRVLQQKDSNYDTDIFTGTIQKIASFTGRKYENSQEKKDIAFRVIADHIRAIAFTIADGQLPSNTGAGYVIRRILRRAVRYYYSYLDYKQPLLFQLIPVLAEQFKAVFPELSGQTDFVTRVVKEEEEAFLRTLDKGLKKIDEVIAETRSAGNRVINGKAAFELFDTFGFPADLTRLIATEQELEMDEAAFEKEMQQQKDRSRAASVTEAEDWILLDGNTPVEFTGYNSLEENTRIVRYRKVKAKGKEVYQLVLERTPFYAESGGQAGDAGELRFHNFSLPIYDTKKENDLIIHFADSLPDAFDEEVLAKVNVMKRQATAIHHSATHLLHAALRKVLGAHVTQKGSLVNEAHLRFDFSHFAKLSDDEIKNIESLVNAKIRENLPVIIEEMPKEKAMAIGAMALFGEKYGDTVRVVIIDPGYSVELCGGTHVGCTGELGIFKIIHETAVAAGVRRIEAVSGTAAEEYIQTQLEQLQGIKQQLKNPKELLKSVEALMNENAELKKKLEKLEEKQLNVMRKQLVGAVEKVNGIDFLGAIVEVSSADALKKLSFDLRNDLKNFLVVLAADINGKASIAVSIDEELCNEKKLDATKIIKEYVAPLIKGGGGGQKTLATAGGQEVGRLKQVIEKVKLLIS